MRSRSPLTGSPANAIGINLANRTLKRAYIIADNKIALNAGWNLEFLQAELQGLTDLGFDIGLTGFELAEMDFVLEEQTEAQKDLGPENLIPAPQDGPAVTQPVDLWILDQHRLLCGDARDSASYRALLAGAKAEFVFTDPPYNVKIAGNVGGKGRVRHKNFAMAAGEMTAAQFTGFLESSFELLAAHTTNGSVHYFCIDWRHSSELLTAGRRVFGEPKNLCVRVKTNAGMGTFYRSQHELVFVYKNGDAPHINNFELGQHGRTRTNVWTYRRAYLGSPFAKRIGLRAIPPIRRNSPASGKSPPSAERVVVDAVACEPVFSRSRRKNGKRLESARPASTHAICPRMEAHLCAGVLPATLVQTPRVGFCRSPLGQVFRRRLCVLISPLFSGHFKV